MLRRKVFIKWYRVYKHSSNPNFCIKKYVTLCVVSKLVYLMELETHYFFQAFLFFA